jgi:aldehyde dehydrogenase (NAD+)
VLSKLADLIERDAQILAELESFNAGKGVRIAREADVGDTIACLRYYAGLGDKIHGESAKVAPGGCTPWCSSKVARTDGLKRNTTPQRNAGQTIDSFGKEKMVYTLHEPIGVCGQM